MNETGFAMIMVGFILLIALVMVHDIEIKKPYTNACYPITQDNNRISQIINENKVNMCSNQYSNPIGPTQEPPYILDSKYIGGNND